MRQKEQRRRLKDERGRRLARADAHKAHTIHIYDHPFSMLARPRDFAKYRMAGHSARAQPTRSPGDARCLAQLRTEAGRAEQEAALERRRELDVRRRVVRLSVEV